MNKKILQSIFFSAFIIILLYTIQYGLDMRYRAHATNKINKLLLHKTDANVMIFGSSVAYHQFQPVVIDSITYHSSYNMGWPGMFYIQYRGLIREYLSYQQHCKCIVIACDYDNMGKNDLITNPDLFYAWLDNRNIYSSLHDIEPQKILLARYVPGYKLTLLNKTFYATLVLPQKNDDSFLGFEPLSNNWEPSNSTGSHDTRYDDEVFRQFSTDMQAIAAKGIKVIIVIPPVYTSGYKLIQNAQLIEAKYASLVQKNIYFLNYTTDSICNNRAYFHNYTHLDSAGATVFSHIFAQDLLKILHE